MMSSTLLRCVNFTTLSRATMRGSPILLPRHSHAPSLISFIGKRSIFIQVETTPNPDSLKFVPEGQVVLPEQFGTGLHFQDIGQARSSRLARRLLKLEQITGVFLGRDFVSVNKREEATWAALKPIVLDAMMDAFAELETKGTPIVTEAQQAPDTRITEDDDEVTAMIKELLETRIRPAVQEDGGDIFFRGFNASTGIVRLQMAGSCVGCPSSTATLRSGVENMLIHYIPEVKGIEQVQTELEAEAEMELHKVEQRLADAGAEVTNSATTARNSTA